ncbi:hypothetical protein ACF0H5_000319 [Mactra antiquata]
MVKGSQEYQRELKSSYLTLFKDRGPEKNTEHRVDQHSDSEVSAEHNDGSSGSSSGNEGLNPAVPPKQPEKRHLLDRLPGCVKRGKDASVRTTQRRVEEEHSLPSSYKEFKSSVYVTEIREKFMCRPFMHLKDMTGILIVLICFCNWPHVSVYKNVRFVDIERATTDDDNLYIISVGKHKTSGMGPGKKAAFLTVDKDIYSELKLYARTIRDVLKPIDISAQLFRGNTGQPTDINRLAKSTWRKAGMPEEFSLTQMKKLTTFHGGKINTAMAGEIACQLCHRESTADQYYAMHDDRQSAVRVYKHLKQSFSQRSTTQTYAEACQSGEVDDALSLEGPI